MREKIPAMKFTAIVMANDVRKAIIRYLDGEYGGLFGEQRALKLFSDCDDVNENAFPNFLLNQIIKEFSSSKELRVELIKIYHSHVNLTDVFRFMYEGLKLQSDSGIPDMRMRADKLIIAFFNKSAEDVDSLILKHRKDLYELVVVPHVDKLVGELSFKSNVLIEIKKYIDEIKSNFMKADGFKRALNEFFFTAITKTDEECKQHTLNSIQAKLGSSVNLRLRLSRVVNYWKEVEDKAKALAQAEAEERAKAEANLKGKTSPLEVITTFDSLVQRELEEYISAAENKKTESGSDGIRRAKLLLSNYTGKSELESIERLEYDFTESLVHSTILRKSLKTLYKKHLGVETIGFDLISQIKYVLEDYKSIAEHGAFIAQVKEYLDSSLTEYVMAKEYASVVEKPEYAQLAKNQYHESVGRFITANLSNDSLSISLGWKVARFLGISPSEVKAHTIIAGTGQSLPIEQGLRLALNDAWEKRRQKITDENELVDFTPATSNDTTDTIPAKHAIRNLMEVDEARKIISTSKLGFYHKPVQVDSETLTSEMKSFLSHVAYK